MITKSRIYAEINLDHISDNFDKMHAHLKPGTMMAAVIKADGYGHGAVPIGRMLEEKDYIWGFAVATTEEALELRAAGITKPVMLLGCVFPEGLEDLIRADVRLCVFSEDLAEEVAAAARSVGRRAAVHIALDTGMGRIGFAMSDEAIESAARICAMEELEVEGIFSHFARADETDHAAAKAQLEHFLYFTKRLEEMGLRIPIYHCSNSAGILGFPEANLDMVRAGISLYGLDPSDEVPCKMLDLKPAMSLHARISYVKRVPAGTAISYGGTYVTAKESVIATIPVGYADGYPRLLSNKGEVLVKGQRAPIRGRVCMDQFMVDVTDIPDVHRGDPVVLLGNMGEETIRAEELGGICGRFNYELACCVNKRVPRIYIHKGTRFTIGFENGNIETIAIL
ncbi:MAG: alanine racemase [Lachnospiraceae bacterium]|nr:alanine racemase [Lachnospiraceae bacterium]